MQILEDPPVPEPDEGELMIEVIFSGINPADLKHATFLGVRSTIMGYDFCGRVVKGTSTALFAPGDIVAGYTPTGVGRPLKYGSHQRYLCCPEDWVFSVPPKLPLAHAACLSVAATTAADALYNCLQIPAPGKQSNERHTLGPLLIWGCSTSVGLCMLQFARASGIHPIFATASSRRHSILRKYGATTCFDYSSPDVVSQILKAVDEYKCGAIAFAVDAVGSRGEHNSADLMVECVGENANMVSVIPRSSPKFKLPFALIRQPSRFQQPNNGPGMVLSPNPSHVETAKEALQWAVEHYGEEFSLPSVGVLDGEPEEVLKEIRRAAELGSFGKLVIRHPL